jgi:hypothetical protein
MHAHTRYIYILQYEKRKFPQRPVAELTRNPNKQTNKPTNQPTAQTQYPPHLTAVTMSLNAAFWVSCGSAVLC